MERGAAREPALLLLDACGLRGEKRRLAFVFFSNSQNDHGSCMLQREALAQTQEGVHV